uniref:LigA n=1 Tax=Parastrongyloides trichosuri TaxID=131310 RepID=A0A0N4YZX6_PARTI
MCPLGDLHDPSPTKRRRRTPRGAAEGSRRSLRARRSGHAAARHRRAGGRGTGDALSQLRRPVRAGRGGLCRTDRRPGSPHPRTSGRSRGLPVVPRPDGRADDPERGPVDRDPRPEGRGPGSDPHRVEARRGRGPADFSGGGTGTARPERRGHPRHRPDAGRAVAHGRGSGPGSVEPPRAGADAGRRPAASRARDKPADWTRRMSHAAGPAGQDLRAAGLRHLRPVRAGHRPADRRPGAGTDRLVDRGGVDRLGPARGDSAADRRHHYRIQSDQSADRHQVAGRARSGAADPGHPAGADRPVGTDVRRGRLPAADGAGHRPVARPVLGHAVRHGGGVADQRLHPEHGKAVEAHLHRPGPDRHRRLHGQPRDRADPSGQSLFQSGPAGLRRRLLHRPDHDHRFWQGVAGRGQEHGQLHRSVLDRPERRRPDGFGPDRHHPDDPREVPLQPVEREHQPGPAAARRCTSAVQRPSRHDQRGSGPDRPGRGRLDPARLAPSAVRGRPPDHRQRLCARSGDGHQPPDRAAGPVAGHHRRPHLSPEAGSGPGHLAFGRSRPGQLGPEPGLGARLGRPDPRLHRRGRVRCDQGPGRRAARAHPVRRGLGGPGPGRRGPERPARRRGPTGRRPRRRRRGPDRRHLGRGRSRHAGSRRRERPRPGASGPDRSGQHPHRRTPRRTSRRGRGPCRPAGRHRHAADHPGARRDLGHGQYEGNPDARRPRRPAGRDRRRRPGRSEAEGQGRAHLARRRVGVQRDPPRQRHRQLHQGGPAHPGPHLHRPRSGSGDATGPRHVGDGADQRQRRRRESALNPCCNAKLMQLQGCVSLSQPAIGRDDQRPAP